MSEKRIDRIEPDRRTVYQIRLRGHLPLHWSGWFEDLTITLTEGGDTLLTGPVEDQAALHGLLKKVRDLGMPLLLVKCILPDLGNNTETEK